MKGKFVHAIVSVINAVVAVKIYIYLIAQQYNTILSIVSSISIAVVVSKLIELDDFIASMPADTQVCVVAQTTQELELFEAFCERLKLHFKNLEIIDTICHATRLRQEEIKES